ncbi:hypothetical protein JCM5350_001493 [Sporobolomyces pararoseus]
MDLATSPLFGDLKTSQAPSTPTNSTTPRRSRRTPPSSSRQSLKSSASRGSNGYSRRLSFGAPEGNQSPGGGFTFSPESSSSSPSSTKGPSSFDFSSLSASLPGIASSSTEAGVRRIVRLRSSTPRKIGSRKKRGSNLNDLPDELLLRIFSHLDDQQGFRPLSRSSWKGPSWLFPPLRIALVCRRWLPIARQLFYRSIKIHHLERIPPLHFTFTTTCLSLAVRHLSIKLPYNSLDKLNLPSTHPALTSGREPDSDSDVSGKKRSNDKKQEHLPVDQLRTIFQSCSGLLSIEIAGVDPLVLLSSSSVHSASLHHLHQLRLSTISTLILGTSSSQNLSSTTLRQALLALTGLRSLTVKGYVSELALPLEFAPSSTSKGSPARPLPLRARTLLKLKSIAIIDSSMNASDLESLLRHVQKGCIEQLVVNDFYNGKESMERIREGRYGGTTVEGLSVSGIGDLLKGSLRVLRVTLHNFPLARDALSAAQSSPPPPPRRRLSGVPAPPDPPHILDRFISSLQVIETLDVGGSLVTSSLLLPSSSSLDDHLLPSTVRYLTVRACPALAPSVVLSFLQSLARSRQSSQFSPSSPVRAPSSSANTLGTRRDLSQLQVLEVLGGSESGWKNPIRSFEIQKACWASKVQWRGDGKWKPEREGEWRMGATQGQNVW